MSEQQLQAFLAKVNEDSGLQEKLKSASGADAIVAKAQEEGFVLSIDDLRIAQLSLSEEELEGLCGGVLTVVSSIPSGAVDQQ